MAQSACALPYVLSNEVIGWPADEGGNPVGDIAAGMAAVKVSGKLSHWYSYDPNDEGGATAWGITLDTAKHYGIGTIDELQAITADKVAEVYRADYWRFNGVMNQRVATKLLDMAVNMGPDEATRITQKGLNDLGAGLTPDGIWGPKTELCVNSVSSDHMLDLLCIVARDHYLDRVLKKPNQREFIGGWLVRARKVPHG